MRYGSTYIDHSEQHKNVRLQKGHEEVQANENNGDYNFVRVMKVK